MVLAVSAQDFVRRRLPDVECSRRRHGARIGGEQVAAGRQHVRAAPCGRARGTGGDVAAIERGDQRSALGFGAGAADRIRFIGRGAAKNVQPVLDGEILEVAEPGVDAAQGLVGRVRGADASLAGKAGF